MTPKRAPRLKDTCDRCSASKVKCAKQRPQCSRCKDLGYQCFYSAARRKGRPHPSQNEDAQSVESEEPAEWPPKRQKTAPKPGHVSDLSGAAAGILPGYQQATSTCKDWTTSMPFYNNAESCTAATETSSPHMILSHQSSSFDLFDNANDSTKAWSGKSNYSDNSSTTECSDCALLAMKTLQHLTTTPGQPLPQAPSSSGPFQHLDLNRSTLDARIHTVSTAIRCLSAILVCPCSCSPDVGLLCAALCAAILDSHWTILQSSQGLGSHGSVDVDNIMTSGFGDLDRTISLINDMMSGPEHTQLGAESPDRTVNQQVIVRRVLEELPKAANVVMQFTRRYNDSGEAAALDNGNEDVALLLPMLAIGQKTRLKDMVDKATNLLVLQSNRTN